jgi:hypothetical protein
LTFLLVLIVKNNDDYTNFRFVDLHGIPDFEDKVNFEEGSRDSFGQDEVLLDTGSIQLLVKVWDDTKSTEEET